MPQPVQPPEPPAIIQPSNSEEATRSEQASNGAIDSIQNQTLLTGGLATPTPPERFLPESSSLSLQQSAAVLGPRISVGYRRQAAPVATQEVELSQFDGKSSDLSLRNASGEQPANSQPYSLRLSTNIERLIAQDREGEVREFEFTVPTQETEPLLEEGVTPESDESEDAPQPAPEAEVAPTADESEDAAQPSQDQESETPVTPPPQRLTGVLEVTSDRQEYNETQQVITGEGNVKVRFREALLDADRVQINLATRILVASGNVALTRGEQVLRGERFEYYFVQDSGVILNASGEVYTPTSGSDLNIFSPTAEGVTTGQPTRPVSDRITVAQPLLNITNPGFYSFQFGGSITVDPQTGRSNPRVEFPQSGGTINRFRYEADRIDFEGGESIATNVRLTNDPFSPPELELRADTARFRRIAPLVDEVVASRPRLVFDQGFSVPTIRNRVVIDRRQRDPGLVNFGFDEEDRGGLFAESTFDIINTPSVRFRVTPQYYIQKAILGDDDGGGGVISPSSFGLRSQLQADFSPRTSLTGNLVLTSLDLGELEDEARARLQLQQTIGTTLPHTLGLEYAYRDRVFNGSLGFRTVQSSIGLVLNSPTIALGQTGVNLSYQAAIQNISARTDREDLLPPLPRDNDRINLTRYQANASLSKGFLLWQGEALPATPTEGMRYTPAPVLPNVQLYTNATGAFSAYSNGDTQESLSGSISLIGQFGHFSRPFLDYTGFNIGYTQVLLGNESPFLFDRVADSSVLSAGITQQIYGPFRLGFQTYYNLDTGEEISTDFFVEYSRRAYNIILRYNPSQQIGSIGFQINDFNWTGNPGLFDRSEIRPVMQGVTQ